MRLTRAIWALLTLFLVVALAITWGMTRPDEAEAAWVGAVAVLAGDGRDGSRDGPADEARFSEPFGIAATEGAIFVSDAGGSHRIRRIGADGTVSTLAGDSRGFADGRGRAARFSTPSGIALAPDGSLVVADTGNNAIRRVTPDGSVTTVAGDGIAGYIDGPGARARFNGPVGVAVDTAGRIIVADTYNDRVRVIDLDGEVRTLAGGDDEGRARSPLASSVTRDGPGPDARFDTPCGVAMAPDGRVLVADTGNGVIRAIAADGQVTTLLAPTVGLERPMAIVSAPTGDIYVADERGAVILVPAEGDARLLAGGNAGFADGVASEARFRRPSGLGIAGFAPGSRRSIGATVLVADAGNAMVRSMRLVAIDGVRAGAAGVSWPWTAPGMPAPPRPHATPAFDVEAFRRLPLLWPIAPLDGPHEVAGTFGEARGEVGQERFHAGLDVRENQGTPVHAVRDGIVSSPIATAAFDTLNESLRIGPLTYVHIRAGRERSVGRARSPNVPSVETAGSDSRPYAASIGAASSDLQRFAPVYDDTGVMTRMRAKRGAFFATGDVVGTVNAFNHVHLNVGWSGEEHNPLGFRLVQFTDGIAPSIATAGVRLFDEAWTPLNPDRPGPMRGRGRRRRPTHLPPLEPVVVRGRVRIVVDAWDQADGNKAYRRLGLYAIGYTVTTRVGPAPPARRRLGGGGSAAHAGDPCLRNGDAAQGDAGVRPDAARRRCREAGVCDRQRHSCVWREPHAVPVCRDHVVSRRHRNRGVLGHDDSSLPGSTCCACSCRTSAATRRVAICGSSSCPEICWQDPTPVGPALRLRDRSLGGGGERGRRSDQACGTIRLPSAAT